MSIHVDNITTRAVTMQYPVDEMSTETFAEWFSKQLARRGWNQSAFSRASGIPRQTVSTWVRGTRTPEPKSIDLIAEAFEYDRDVVLAKAGIRLEESEDSEEVTKLIGMIRRVKWDELRLSVVESVLHQLIEAERKKQ